MTKPDADASTKADPGSLGWWVRDRDGHLAIAMFPNPAIWVWLIARVLGWSGWSGVDERTLRDVGTGALIVWALDESARGASPVRRVLGGVVLGLLVVTLVV